MQVGVDDAGTACSLALGRGPVERGRRSVTRDTIHDATPSRGRAPFPRGSSAVRIVSWNVNGLRACARKGFLRFLAGSGADVVGIQEVRAFEHQLEPSVRAPDGWHAAFSAGERPGYSGVALYSRETPMRIETALGEPRFDAEGRLLIARFGTPRRGIGLLSEGERPGPEQPPRALQARFLRGALRPPAGAAAPRAGSRRRRLQHGARTDRPGATRRQHENERLPAGGTGGAGRAGSTPVGWTPSAGSIPARPATTPGGGSGARRGATTSAGGSTTCWPRRPPRGGSRMPSSGRTSPDPTTARSGVALSV